MPHVAWQMADGEMAALPSSSPSPRPTEHVHFVPALLFLLLFFALFLLLLFGALAAHAPTRLASVGFSPRFPLAHFPFNPCTSLPTVLPSPYCHFHMQSACCRIFFLLPSLLAFFVLVGQKSTHELWHF